MTEAMAENRGSTPASKDGIALPLLVPLLAGAAITVFLGVYGNQHDPSGRSLYSLFFTNTIHLKAWFATVAVALALFQLLSALRIYGRISVPANVPPWLGDAHRVSGLLAFIVSLPVAYHCLWSLGYQTATTRVAVHSGVGCFFYGAMAIKIFAVRDHRLPSWFLPVAGGVTFTSLVVIWWTSSLWFFTNVNFGI